MTITKAMRKLQRLAASDTEAHATRKSGGCWIKFIPKWTYRLDADELTADDWEIYTPTPEGGTQ